MLQKRLKKRRMITGLDMSYPSASSLEEAASAYEWYAEPRSRGSKSVVSINSVYHQPLTRSSSAVLEAYCGDFDSLCQPEADGLFSPSGFVLTAGIGPGSLALQNVQSKRKRLSMQLTEPEEFTIVRDRDDEFQILRHVILLLAMGCSMFVVSQIGFLKRAPDKSSHHFVVINGSI